jgi:transposase-like protein
MAKKGQKFEKYSKELRLQIVHEKINEGKSYSSLADKYGMSSKTIETWVRIFRRDGSLDVKKRGKPKQDNNTDYKEKYEILKKFQKFLKEVDREKK